MKSVIETVVFVSNFFNHHQRPFSEAMFSKLGEGYTFVETEAISQERLDMGWEQKDVPSYVLPFKVFTMQRNKVQHLIDTADVVIFGSAPSELLVRRTQTGKQIFRYSERPLKVNERWKYPIRLFTWRKALPQKRSIHMLCASAYTAGDYAHFGLFHNRCYKWGYFPETKLYDVDALMAQKRISEPPSILWAGRFLGWKHPNASILLAELLRKKGYHFELNIIGNGALEEPLKAMIQEKKLGDYVHLLGSMSPERVRTYMETADIFLFTSDFNEGWGTVLNESMNSGCAVVASHAIGSVPFLVEEERNGLIYRNGDLDDLCEKVSSLIEYPDKRQKLGRHAYQTIVKTWNAQVAATRFLKLAEALQKGESASQLYDDGPCSKAGKLKNNWYKS